MEKVLLEFSEDEYLQLQRHLLPHGYLEERAAFACASAVLSKGVVRLRCVDLLLLDPCEFKLIPELVYQLSDVALHRAIKTAHNMKASLIEFHSHPGPYPAAFSRADINGFAESVPHLWWRLKGAPYAAVVMAPKGIDALAWTKDPRAVVPVSAVVVGNRLIKPTGLTFSRGSSNG